MLYLNLAKLIMLLIGFNILLVPMGCGDCSPCLLIASYCPGYDCELSVVVTFVRWSKWVWKREELTDIITGYLCKLLPE